MSVTTKRARQLLLASAVAMGASGVAMAQDQQPMQAPMPSQGQMQQAQPMQEQQPMQGQMQAQPIAPQMQNQPLKGMPVDQVTTVDGVEAICSGIGKGTQTTPATNFPVKFETVGAYGQWLGNASYSISGNGQQVNLQCSGPWVSARLNPGNYTVTVNVPGGGAKTQKVSVPASGSREVMFRFENVHEGESPDHKAAPVSGT